MEDPVVITVTDTLDLHFFRPKEIKDLLDEYLRVCVDKRFSEVRLIHGKGTGQLRERVHAILRRDDRVKDFRLAGHGAGEWGATLVRLHLPV